MQKFSILEYCGLSENGSCGYCKNSRKRNLGTVSEQVVNTNEAEGDSVSLGVWAHNLSSLNYQHMLDSGWRRAGKYIYKPIMEKTCCPQYTIRLEATKYYLSRSQRKVLRQMIEFLKNDIRPRCAVREEVDCPKQFTTTTDIPNKASSGNSKRSFTSPMKKKQMRRERCFKRWEERGLNLEDMQKQRIEKENARRRTIESYSILNDANWKHRLEVKLVKTGAEEFKERADESYLLYVKYQSMVHHDKDLSKAGYKRFLLDSPLFADDCSGSLYTCGSYHQWYILDGSLIAVGVVDILPRCLSSKYLFYDPEYSFLSLGTYTALREIEFTRELNKQRPELKYYYMGYYIDTCPKMRYKGNFRPSELLCDCSFEWVPLDECCRLLRVNDNKFTVFRPNAPISRRKTKRDLELLVDGQVLSFDELIHFQSDCTSINSLSEKLELFASKLSVNVEYFLIYVEEIQSINRGGT